MGIPPAGYFCKQQRRDVERVRAASTTRALAADFVVVARVLITRKTRRANAREKVGGEGREGGCEANASVSSTGEKLGDETYIVCDVRH